MTTGLSGCKGYLQVLASMNVAVGDFYLLLGHTFAGQALPADVQRGPARQCYQNAAALALEAPTLTYCEGYACPADLIPVHHAWCVTAAGDVVDPTWPKCATAEYFGIAMNTPWLMAQLAKSGTWGLLAERIPSAWLEVEPHIYIDPAWLPEGERLRSFAAKRQEWLRPTGRAKKNREPRLPVNNASGLDGLV